MKFSKTNTNDAQTFNLFIKTQFIKIQKSMITPEPKIIPTNFDKWLAVIKLLIIKLIFF